MSFLRLSASAASCGRLVRRLERWSEDATMAGLDLAESDCKDKSVEWEDCASDCGSEAVKDARGRVVSRFRYFVVIASWPVGTGRGEVGVSKYGTSNSYNGSAMTANRAIPKTEACSLLGGFSGQSREK